ncbi:hypothetical protein KSF_052150 [Reticulibacter mediterranei]|uniref:Uncharacterized protein n=1 Tax=Reticulibacter mediterranei TaxID=2778369 RepID=A0A8J3N278_9CHLR|nr:hypothetical protein KSF_052150 [Reticulibacter mediterranei]
MGQDRAAHTHTARPRGYELMWCFPLSMAPSAAQRRERGTIEGSRTIRMVRSQIRQMVLPEREDA